MSTTYILNRVQMYENIKNTINGMGDTPTIDPFLGMLGDIEHPLLYKPIEAHTYLFTDPIIKSLCTNIKSNKLPILIGGSVAMRVMYRNARFTPGDIDMYIKCIDSEKVKTLDSCIHSIFPEQDNTILLVRSPIVLTWLISNKTTGKIVTQIQLNMLNIKHSWAEYFITCHSDISCAGYDILKNKFVYLENAWENILDQNKTHYFTNLLNCDSTKSLSKAVDKYIMRGFKCEAIIISSKTTQKNNIINNSSDDDEYGIMYHNNVAYIPDAAQPIANYPRQRLWVSEPSDDDESLSDDEDYVHSYQPVNNLARVEQTGVDPLYINHQQQYALNLAEFPALQASDSKKQPEQSNNDKALLRYLKSKYSKITNIAYAFDVDTVFPPDHVINPDMINLWEIRDQPEKYNEFINFPGDIIAECSNPHNCDCDNICPIEQEHHNLMIANSLCSHKLSLRVFVCQKLKLCPMCRAEFKPYCKIIQA